MCSLCPANIANSLGEIPSLSSKGFLAGGSLWLQNRCRFFPKSWESPRSLQVAEPFYPGDLLTMEAADEVVFCSSHKMLEKSGVARCTSFRKKNHQQLARRSTVFEGKRTPWRTALKAFEAETTCLYWKGMRADLDAGGWVYSVGVCPRAWICPLRSRGKPCGFPSEKKGQRSGLISVRSRDLRIILPVGWLWCSQLDGEKTTSKDSDIVDDLGCLEVWWLSFERFSGCELSKQPWKRPF